MARLGLINKLCDEYCQNVNRPNGSIALNANTHDFELLNNDIYLPELDQKELLATIIGLSKTLLLTGQLACINQDHVHLWGWCAQLATDDEVETRARINNEFDELDKLFELVIRGALARSYPNAQAPNNKEIQNHFATHFVNESSLAIAYLGFPLLEGILKRLAHNYVGMDGAVKTNFSVAKRGGGNINYGPRQKNKCSSIRDLLTLYTDHIAEPEQVTLLNEFYGIIKIFGNTTTPIDLIGDWRNQSLHGTTSFISVGYAILHLCLLISVGEIRGDFSSHTKLISKKAMQWYEDPSNRQPWSFYPPN